MSETILAVGAGGKFAGARFDVVERLRTDAPLNKPDPSSFYGVGPKGYTVYPTLKTAKAA